MTEGQREQLELVRDFCKLWGVELVELASRSDLSVTTLSQFERGMAQEALAAFEATIRKEPNRLNAFVGAAKAAVALGDKNKAKAYYQKLAALAESPDAGRPDLAAAREYLAKN